MDAPVANISKPKVSAVAGAIALALFAASSQAQVTQSNERKNMMRVGHTDLQGRPAYQPNVIRYPAPDNRYILFVGMHSGAPVPRAACNNSTSVLPNPLKAGAPCENNGTMLIDVTNPNAPVELSLIPAPTGGQAQMTRMCLGRDLPAGPADKASRVYLQRNVQGGPSAGYEVWDVTNPLAPVLVSELRNIRNTHKQWWECNTGLMYAPGSLNQAALDAAGQPSALWRQAQSMLVYDWSNPTQAPVFIRAFGLPGAQPGATGPVPTSLHGPISTFEHPQGHLTLTRGHDVISNRIYASWGVGDDGVHTTIDRKKLLPAAYGGTWVPANANSAYAPTEEELIGPASPTVTYFLMSPDQGGHTSMPIFRIQPPSYQKFNEFPMRDFVILSSEATADTVADPQGGRKCNEAPHWTFMLDVTVENSMSAPPGTRLQHDAYHGPMVLSTLSVDPRFGERYARGNYCNRGARFGVHSSEENFRNPFYGKLTAIAWFNGGVRVWDIREPQEPVQIAFYVPEANANTEVGAGGGYMTNNVEIDDRGYVYIVDRNGAGFDLLRLTGCADTVGRTGNGSCPNIK